MNRFIRTPLIALSTLLLVPMTLNAQQQGPPPEVQEMMAEMQQIQARLLPLQERALEDEALLTQRDETTAAVRSAMIAIDADIGTALDRLEEMMREMAAAQQASDMETIVALNQEAQELQPRIAAVQGEALAQPEVAERIEAFQAHLQARMIELDPEARSLFERRDDLDRRLRAATGG
jgi:chromosome segregation ATPase